MLLESICLLYGPWDPVVFTPTLLTPRLLTPRLLTPTVLTCTGPWVCTFTPTLKLGHESLGCNEIKQCLLYVAVKMKACRTIHRRTVPKVVALAGTDLEKIAEASETPKQIAESGCG